jgi:uncharacterized membrane protein
MRIAYPVLPWIGIIAGGYAFATILDLPGQLRRRRLLQIGGYLTLAFVALRVVNVYGDPKPWSVKSPWGYTILSFLNTDKYPPSLLFTMMTLGPLIACLGLLDRPLGRLAWPFSVLGRVPLFYYLLHIPLIHLLAVLLARARYGHAEFLFQNPPASHGPSFPLPDDYGYPLPVIYLIWIALVALLVVPCRLYGRYKAEHPNRWLTYLL